MLHSVERSIERCASNNISRDNENPVTCCCFLYSNFELLGRTPSKFRPSEQFSYTFIPNNFQPLRKHLFSGREGKHPVVLVTWWDPNIYY